MSQFVRYSMRIALIIVCICVEGSSSQLQKVPQARLKNSLTTNHPASSASFEMDEVKAGAAFLNIFRLLVDEYVDHIGAKQMRKMLEGAVQGMLSSLDPHSGVVQQNLLEEMEGEFGGLGIQISPVPIKGTDRTELTVVSILEGSPKTPAQIAGLKPKDVIVAIDDTFYDRYDEAVKKMRGAPGTKVTLTLKRKVLDKEKIFNISLTRALIKVDSVKFRLEPHSNTGYIRISVFDAKTSTLVAKALRDLYKSNPKLNSIVIDLRNNYGGYLDQAIKVASLFLSSGTVVKVKDKKNIRVHSVIPHQVIVGKDGLYDAALLVLVNGYSASASEILAAALKDHNRAIIVGRVTFGKGSVQEVKILDSYLAFKFTSSRFYSPKGSPIQGAGVIPHVILKMPQDLSEGNKLEIKESNLPGSLERKLLNPTLTLPEELQLDRSRKNLKPSSHGVSPERPRTFASLAMPVLGGDAKNDLVLESEVDYDLLQAMDLAKALGEQFEQYTLRQNNGKQK
ncbi:S41 family peptidase [Holospora curviuscula]|uniref:Putative CtpA-like serine protease n=1 Tax=Holospora curviuscula TaxID=1082868 RepID=A0A2S5RA86_9PROT|nr:S41 family peptidase [Holospora curviuscula]PPE04210.1 putative CtpA-like serine protease [Holospora curviuscula]